MDESHDPALSGCECHNPRLGTRTPLLAHPLGTSRGLCCCSFSLSSRIVSPLKISPGWVLHCWAQDLPCLYLPSPPKVPHRLRSQLETPQPFLPKFKGGSLVVWGHLEASPGFKGAGKGCCLSTVRGKSRGEGSEPQRGLQNPVRMGMWGCCKSGSLQHRAETYGPSIQGEFLQQHQFVGLGTFPPVFKQNLGLLGGFGPVTFPHTSWFEGHSGMAQVPLVS